jgi:23S rRNA pseudouridine1911/1915/1917 synthase
MIPRVPGEGPLDLSRPLQELRIQIEARQDGQRLDKALAEHLTWRSRTSIHRLIDDGFVSLEGRAARAAGKVRGGEIVVVRIPAAPEPSARVAPDDDAVSVVHEDRWMIAVDKPPGLAVHPAGRRVYGTLIHWLHVRYRRPETPANDVVPRLLHRLDRETSGIVAASLDADFHHVVARHFEGRLVSKTYLAVVHGRPPQTDGLIDLGIGPARGSVVRLKLEARADGSGLPALTRYRVVRSNERYSLVEMEPKTGRTHQLRVHMAALGCPLVGDKIYLDETIFLEELAGALSDATRARLVLDRQALHAHRLRFHHPRLGRDLVLEAPLPADMAALVP